jgi:hypothetical protein
VPQAVGTALAKENAIKLPAMNKSNKLLSLVFVTAAAGAVLFSFANAPFTAALRGDVILGIGASVALLGLAAFDYSRRARSLNARAQLLRPTLPVCPAPRASAYDSRNSRKDGVAA